MLTGPRLRERVTILHAELVAGSYNSRTRDWANAVPTVGVPAAFEQIGSTEDVVLQQRTETRWRMTLLPSTVLRADARVVRDGKTLEVVGEPDRPRDPLGRVHHVEAVVRAVSGG